MSSNQPPVATATTQAGQAAPPAQSSATGTENDGNTPSSESGGRGNSDNGGRRNRVRRNNSNANDVQASNPISFDGDVTDFGSVLGMRLEKFTKKVPFQQFKKKVYNYVITHYTDVVDLMPLFKRNEDPYA